MTGTRRAEGLARKGEWIGLLTATGQTETERDSNCQLEMSGTSITFFCFTWIMMKLNIF